MWFLLAIPLVLDRRTEIATNPTTLRIQSDPALTSRLLRQTTLLWVRVQLLWSLEEISEFYKYRFLLLYMSSLCLAAYTQKVSWIVNSIYNFLPTLIMLNGFH